MLTPRGLLFGHMLVWFAVMRFERLWPLRVRNGQWRALPDPVDCVAAMLYQHRLQRGAAERLAHHATFTYETMVAWSPRGPAGWRSLSKDRLEGKQEESVTSEDLERQEARDLASDAGGSNQSAKVLQSHGLADCFLFSYNVSWRHMWGTRPEVAVSRPSQVCVSMCRAYLAAEAWLGPPEAEAGPSNFTASDLVIAGEPSAPVSYVATSRTIQAGKEVTVTEKRVRRSGSFDFVSERHTRSINLGHFAVLTSEMRDRLLQFLSMLDWVVSLGGAAWVLRMVIVVEHTLKVAPEAEYLALGAPLRRGLLILALAQLLMALSYAVCFSGLLAPSLLGADAFLTAVALSLALQVQEHTLALFYFGLLGMVWAGLGLCAYFFLMVPVWKLSTLSHRFLKMLIMETVLDGRVELSDSSSQAFKGHDSEESVCAICLDSLHPETSAPARFRTSLERLRPRLRTSTSTVLQRSCLVRLRCGHAFHRGCFHSIALNATLPARYACPTCRARNDDYRWRRQLPGLAQVVDFVRSELPDMQMICAVLLLLVLLVATLAALELLVRFMEALMSWHAYLHTRFGIAKPLLNSPFKALLLFYQLRKMGLGLRQAIAGSIVLAIPVAYLLWSVPNFVVFSALIVAPFYVLQM